MSQIGEADETASRQSTAAAAAVAAASAAQSPADDMQTAAAAAAAETETAGTAGIRSLVVGNCLPQRQQLATLRSAASDCASRSWQSCSRAVRRVIA